MNRSDGQNEVVVGALSLDCYHYSHAQVVSL